jgi:hypothetical protein
VNLHEFKQLSPAEKVGQYHYLYEDEKEALWAESSNGHHPPEQDAVDGATWLLETDLTVEPIWGSKDVCLWSKGEPFYIFSAPGVGKSTLLQALAMRRAGLRGGDVLEHPVVVDERKLLYLACDRPRQIARSWRRMVSEDDTEALRVGVSVWEGPPPFTVSNNPESLVPWIESFGDIGTVVVDSFFNFAPSLSDEEGSANANNAFQALMAAGIELVVLHHDRKRDQNSRRKVSMDDMYGGRPITGGAGAILFLDGEPNSLKFTCRWLKAPAGPVNDIDVRIDKFKGEVELDWSAEF